jgi:hypothetical protein
VSPPLCAFPHKCIFFIGLDEQEQSDEILWIWSEIVFIPAEGRGEEEEEEDLYRAFK